MHRPGIGTYITTRKPIQKAGVIILLALGKRRQTIKRGTSFGKRSTRNQHSFRYTGAGSGMIDFFSASRGSALRIS